MTTLPVHQDQINAGIQKSLLDAGVPAPFVVGRSLTEFADGAAMVDFVTRGSAPEGSARTGSFLRVDYARPGPIPQFHLMARAFQSKGIGVQTLAPGLVA